MIDALIGDGADNAKKLQSIEEYAVESSINKVACSEALDYVVDEMVQIYGGYGYSADYPAEKAYRDSRINRIFEGTNEINRMLIPGQLMKRAMKGKLGLLQAAKALQEEILNPQMSFDEDDELARGGDETRAKRQKDRADGARHGGAEIYDGSCGSAGDPAQLRGHHHGSVPDGNGGPARKEDR